MGTHAPVWERILFAPAKRLASEQRRDAGASQIGSHAGAWEPEKNAGAWEPEKKRDAGASQIGSHAGAWEPEKKMGRWRVPNRFPRRRVGTRNQKRLILFYTQSL